MTKDKGSDTKPKDKSLEVITHGVSDLTTTTATATTTTTTTAADEDKQGVIDAGLVESRMKKALESMVQKLEKKIDTTEAALGDKMNRLLDTDRDGELGNK